MWRLEDTIIIKIFPVEHLSCTHELGNMFDMFAIKTCQGNRTVGHLPMEISRATKFLLDRNAIVTTQLRSSRFRRSPLVQGGLEIPCTATVEMIDTVTKTSFWIGTKNLSMNYMKSQENRCLLAPFQVRQIHKKRM